MVNVDNDNDGKYRKTLRMEQLSSQNWFGKWAPKIGRVDQLDDDENIDEVIIWTIIRIVPIAFDKNLFWMKAKIYPRE